MGLYWWLVLAKFESACSIFALIMIFVSGAGYIVCSLSQYDYSNTELDLEGCIRFTNISRNVLFASLFVGVLCLFAPSKQDLAIMFAWDGLQCDTVVEVVELLKEKLR